MEKPLIHFDKRIAERSIRKGLLTQDEYDGFVQSLHDSEEKAEILNLEEEEAKAAAPPAPPETPPGPPAAETPEAASAPYAALEAPPEAAPPEGEPVDTPDENA